MSSASPQKISYSGALFALVAAFGYSTKAIFVKLAYLVHPIEPITLLTLRMLIALPFFVGMVVWTQSNQNRSTLQGLDIARLIALGLVGYFLSSYFDFVGLVYISASLERLILFVYPTFVILLIASIRGQRIARATIGALVLSYGGIGLVFIQDLLRSAELSGGESSSDTWVGAAFVFAAAITYAIYVAGSQSVVLRVGTARFTGMVMSVSCFAVFIWFFCARSIADLDQPFEIYELAAGMALVSTVLPTWLMAEAISRIGSGPTALIGMAGPVITIALGVMILGESFGVIQMLGATAVILGVFQVLHFKQNQT